ncbi:MAG: O-acetylhomoserine aminocarboxypropyltransferase/cysteine synthase family protein [Haloferacaceae archaeon]
MNDGGDHGFATRSLHVGGEPDPETGARAPPIQQTTSYEFGSSASAAARFRLETEDPIYSRFTNPTVGRLERRIASLSGAPAAVCTASGMAAFDAATSLLASAGDNVVVAEDGYGGTSTYLTTMASRRDVETRTVDTLDPAAYADAADEDTAFVHCETIANPSLVTPPLREIADAAHDAGAPLFVDNTFASPHLCRPVEHGADLVWESTTKWLHGSGTTIGGVAVDGGSFPWREYSDRFPEIGGESPSYGLCFAERFPDRPFAAAVRYRALRTMGATQSPFDAWVTLQGVETLPLRMERHCANALQVAEYLDDHPAVEWVAYPGLAGHETHDAATEYLDDYGGMVSIGLADGYAAARDLCENVELCSFLANVGDAKTLVVHPASTTHSQLSEAEQRAAGVGPELVRISVGIEDPADICADLAEAL